jgi:hypothetical protein
MTLASQDDPLGDKENDENTLDFAFHLSRLFSASVSLDCLCMAHAFFPERLSNHCQGLRRTFSEICTKFDAVLCRIHREIALGQIYDSTQLREI